VPALPEAQAFDRTRDFDRATGEGGADPLGVVGTPENLDKLVLRELPFLDLNRKGGGGDWRVDGLLNVTSYAPGTTKDGSMNPYFAERMSQTSLNLSA